MDGPSVTRRRLHGGREWLPATRHWWRQVVPFPCLPVLIVLLALAVLLGGAAGLAQEVVEPEHRAGLVIRDQQGALSYALVRFAEPELSGMELLKRSGATVVTVSFGGLGEAVCSIQSDGCDVAECQRRLCQGPRADDPFWQSFRQVAPGDWRSQMLGASAARVRDGEVHGWSWTGTVPNLPAVTLDEIAALAETAGIVAPAGAPVALDWPRYAGAGLILAAIAGGAVTLSRWQAARSPAR